MPFPASPQATDYSFTPPGLRPDKPYIFRFRNLSTPGVITNSVPRKAVGSHHLPFPNQTPTSFNGNNYPQGWADSLFITWESDPDSTALTYVVGRNQNGNELFDTVVLTEIELPNGLKYKFSYNIYGEIDKIIYPTGAFVQYQFSATPPIGDLVQPYSQTNRVVTQRQLSPKGDGSDLATWSYAISGGLSTQTISTTAPDGTFTQTSKYNFAAPTQSGVGNPRFWPFGFEDARQGLVREERQYDKSPAQGGVLLRRSLSDFAWTDNPVPPRIGLQGEQTCHAFRNARQIKTVNLLLDTGGDALGKLMTYGYNSNPAYTLTTGLDVTDVTDHHFAGIPQATAQSDTIANIVASFSFPLASTSVTTYMDNGAYQSRNILGLVTSVVLKDDLGQTVSMSENFYDEIGTFPLVTYGDLASDPGYINPGNNTVRGNITTIRRYSDISAGLFLETHAEFDQSGNMTKTWNARATAPFTESNAFAKNEFSSAHKHAFLTRSVSAVPDSSGTHGSNTAFETNTTYDTVTGQVLTVTDMNDQVTTFSYQDDQGQNDPLGRVRRVTRPDGGWTKISFGETLGNLFILTETQQDATRTVKSFQYTDPLGRLSRHFVSEGGANYFATDTIYDQLGRVWKVSNPYRTTTLNGVAELSNTSDWTVTHYDPLSRADNITLPDGQQVATLYQGVYTTVTDQAGRKRRQKVDALGRVVRVDEPNLSGDLGPEETPNQPTSYQYNTLGKLVHITQSTQHRYFKYDALSRLTHERHVEQAAIHAASDPVTGNSAWSRKLAYDETIGGVTYKGLLTTTSDARNIQTEYRYDGMNRMHQVSYSNGSPTVNLFYDQPATNFFNNGRVTRAATAGVGLVPATAQVYNYDLMGRVSTHQQTVGDQTHSMSYSYNLGGALTSQAYPSGRVVSYAFDDASRLSQVSSGSTIYASQFDYSTTPGLLKSVTLGNGAVESFVYNSRLQMTSLDLTKNGTQLQHYDYKYGVYNSGTNTVDESKNTGEVARIEGFIGTAKQWQQNFSYDSLGRLSSAREFPGASSQHSWLVNYEYDVFGNRYQKASQNGGNPFTQVWVEAGQIDSTNNRFNSGVTYDNAGNVTTDSKFRNLLFQYDANNRLKQSSNLDGSNAVVNVYDAGGQRVATQVGGAVINVLVYDATSKLVAEYSSAAPTPNGTQFVTSDLQGSPRAITNNAGVVTSRRDYAPFGEDLAAGIGLRASGQGYSQPNGVRQKFAGMENDDATGMSHTLWRRYDNLSARWTTPDPYAGSLNIRDPQTFNRYSYVENDPVNQVDQLGLMAGADQGWSIVASDFWGQSIPFNQYHFGGPEVIGQALFNHDVAIKRRMIEMQQEKEKKKNQPTSHHAGMHNYQDDPDPDPNPPVEVINTVAFISRDEAIKYFEKHFGGPVVEKFGKFYRAAKGLLNSLPFNPTKALSATVNFANTGRKLATGVTKIGLAFGVDIVTGGAATAPSAAVGVWGAWDLYGASGAYNRGMIQWNEALNEKGSDAHWRNLLGPLPFGQDFDDPNEPLPHVVLKQKIKKPLEFIREIASVTP